VQAPSQGPGTQRDLRAFAQSRLSLWVEGACARERQSLLAMRAAASESARGGVTRMGGDAFGSARGGA
jgi:hypothetical protein